MRKWDDHLKEAMRDMIFKARYERRGSHVHCTFYAGLAGTTFAQIGTLIFNEVEFEQFRTIALFIDFRDGNEVSNAAMR